MRKGCSIARTLSDVKQELSLGLPPMGLGMDELCGKECRESVGSHPHLDHLLLGDQCGQREPEMEGSQIYIQSR